SATPPGAKATMKVMSRAGYGCALAARAPSAPPSAAKAMTTCLKTRQFGISVPRRARLFWLQVAARTDKLFHPIHGLTRFAWRQMDRARVLNRKRGHAFVRADP